MRTPKSMISKVLPVLLVCVLVFLGLRSVWLERDLPPKRYGQPVVIHEPVRIDGSRITQVLEDGRYLYVMVHNHRGYVQVYTLDGKYQFTLSFYHTLNGAFSMALDRNTFYVRDKENNLYQFEDGSFVKFILAEEARELSHGLDFHAWSENYQLHLSSLLRRSDSQCIIKLTAADFLSQYYLDGVLLMLLMLSVAICIARSKRKQNRIQEPGVQP